MDEKEEASSWGFVDAVYEYLITADEKGVPKRLHARLQKKGKKQKSLESREENLFTFQMGSVRRYSLYS